MWLTYIINTVTAFFIAEFITASFHFAEDTYGTQMENALVRKHIVLPNIEHHRAPLKMTQKSWMQTVKATSIAMAAINIIILPPYFLFSSNIKIPSGLGSEKFITTSISFWYFYTMLNIFICSANLIHKWAHTPKNKLPKIIKLLQDCYILQTHYNHSLHHINLNSDYCVMSNIMNKILDYTGFWRAVEIILAKVVHIHPTRV